MYEIIHHHTQLFSSFLSISSALYPIWIDILWLELTYCKLMFFQFVIFMDYHNEDPSFFTFIIILMWAKAALLIFSYRFVWSLIWCECDTPFIISIWLHIFDVRYFNIIITNDTGWYTVLCYTYIRVKFRLFMSMIFTYFLIYIKHSYMSC